MVASDSYISAGEVLEGGTDEGIGIEQIAPLHTIDDLWSGYLAPVAEFQAGLSWLDWGVGGSTRADIG